MNINRKFATAKHILLCCLCALLLSGCFSSPKENARMDRAESLMESDPDSAMTIIDSISLGSLSSQKDKARYALLKSMALDKNYIDTTTFDVLQAAIDYYLEKGSPDEKLRTLYYQGRIYDNSQNEEDALKCFIKASKVNSHISDSLYLGHVYTAMGSIYYNQNKYISSINSYLQGANIYREINKFDFQTDNLLQALDGFINIQDRQHSDSILNILNAIPQKYYDAQPLYLHCKISYATKFLSHKEIKEFIGSISRENVSNDILLDMALGYANIGEGENALACLNSVSDSFINSVKYLAIKSNVQELNGDYTGALTTLRRGIEVSDSIVGKWTGDDRLFADKEYELENEIDAIRKRSSKIRLYSTMTVLVLIIICMVLYLYAIKVKRWSIKNYKRLEHQIHNTTLVNRRLSESHEAYKRVKAQLDEVQKENRELRMENSQMVDEINKSSDGFKKLLLKGSELINELIAYHITSRSSSLDRYNKLLNTIDHEKEKFLKMLRRHFISLYPDFIRKLETSGLTEMEINYVCLYAIGLRPREIGDYLQSKRFYNVNSDIREKLGLEKKDANLGVFIKSEIRKGN